MDRQGRAWDALDWATHAEPDGDNPSPLTKAEAQAMFDATMGLTGCGARAWLWRAAHSINGTGRRRRRWFE